MTTITVADEAEKLVLEQALLAFRATRQAASQAEHGRGLEITERAALEEGRKLTATLLSQTLAAQPGAGKKGPTPSGAGAARARGRHATSERPR
jgi:hypothetical protein